jgi:hypothetical protein
VDFSDNKHLEAAIKKNKQKLLGKKVSIARSDPSKGKKSREAGQAGQGMFFASGRHSVSGIFYIFKIALMDQPKANNYFVEQKGLRTL